MNRLVIFEKNEQLVSQPERLTVRPSGNGAQRRKQIKSGWQSSWVKTGQPTPWVDANHQGGTEEGVEIYNENEHVAELGRSLARITKQEIATQIENFEVLGFVPVPVFIGYELLCWECDQKYACTAHEGHPICNECIEHCILKKYQSASEWDHLSDDLLCELEAA
jgi:hypothetical protein